MADQRSTSGGTASWVVTLCDVAIAVIITHKDTDTVCSLESAGRHRAAPLSRPTGSSLCHRITSLLIVFKSKCARKSLSLYLIADGVLLM